MADVETETTMLGVGQALRDAREAAGKSLDDIAAILKIRESHLQALEEEKFLILPGTAYAIGFIRTYANHLGLNSTDLISRYKSVAETSQTEELAFNMEENAEPISGALKIGIGVVAVLLIYIMWLMGSGPSKPVQQDRKTQSTSEQTGEQMAGGRQVSQPKRGSRKIKVPPEGRPPLVRSTESAVANFPAQQTKPDTELNETSQTSTSATVLPKIDPLARDRQAEVAVNDTLRPPVETLPRPPQRVEVAAVARVQIRAMRRTWMRLENTEGRVLFSSIIESGGTFDLAGEETYTLATRDAGALEYVIDGEAVGPIGRRGQILTSRRLDRADILSRQR